MLKTTRSEAACSFNFNAKKLVKNKKKNRAWRAMDLDEKTISGVVDVCLWAVDFSYKKKNWREWLQPLLKKLLGLQTTAEMVILDYPI